MIHPQMPIQVPQPDSKVAKYPFSIRLTDVNVSLPGAKPGRKADTAPA
jgi:hypothetical protein